MSWSTSANGAKDDISYTAPTYAADVEMEQRDQYEAAQLAAQLLAKHVGRLDDEIVVSESGHANPGHAPRQGWANETITVSVSARPKAE